MTKASKALRRSIRHIPGLRVATGFLYYLLKRFLADNCLQQSAALTYTTLLAFVPLIAISFAIFSAFPAFEDIRTRVQSLIIENLVPEVGPVVHEHIEQFTERAGGLTAVGVVFLGVTAVLLLATVTFIFNQIWRVDETRSLAGRLLVYWAVLTLAPLLFGASLTISSYLFTAAQAVGVEQLADPINRLAAFVPLVLQIAGFSLLYLVIPCFPVRRRDALAGGITAGVLFELLKKGFGFYIENFPTYETIYGALSVVPILLVWMYVAWIVALLGAELTAAMPEWRAGARRVVREDISSARLLGAALAVLHALLVRSWQGSGLHPRHMVHAVPSAPEALGAAVTKLAAARYISKGESGEWLLARDLNHISLHDLRRDLGLDFDLSDLRFVPRHGWGGRFRDLSAKLTEAEQSIGGQSLTTLLAPDPETELIESPNLGDEENSGYEPADAKHRDTPADRARDPRRGSRSGESRRPRE